MILLQIVQVKTVQIQIPVMRNQMMDLVQILTVMILQKRNIQEKRRKKLRRKRSIRKERKKKEVPNVVQGMDPSLHCLLRTALKQPLIKYQIS